MKLKDPTGWFAAGPRMLQALLLLSDGAFRLFAYLSLTADRSTGRLRVTQLELARVLSKSRNSISSYLEELTQHGVCVIKSAPNQHQPGEIEIADAFWPYLKEADSKAAPGPAVVTETHFIEQVRACLLKYSIVCSSFGAADQKLAADLFRDGISFVQLERAFLLGLSRKYTSLLNSTSSSSIYSLAYFTPILDELAEIVVSDKYWDYLRLRLTDLDDAWRDCQRRPRRITSPPDNHQAPGTDQARTDHNACRTNGNLIGPQPGSSSG